MRYTKITFVFLMCVVAFTMTVSGQNSAKTVAAAEIIIQIADGKALNYEDISVVGDFRLINASKSHERCGLTPKKIKQRKCFRQK